MNKARRRNTRDLLGPSKFIFFFNAYDFLIAVDHVDDVLSIRFYFFVIFHVYNNNMDTRRDRRGIAGRSYDTRAVDSARQTARALRNSRKRLKFNRWCVCVCAQQVRNNQHKL